MKTASFLSISTILGFLQIQFLPNANLLAWAFAIIGLDFVTGLIKSAVNKVAITSTGFRNSIKKLIQYIGIILLGALLGNALPKDNDMVRWINDVVLIFIIYTEAYSVVENLRDVNPNSTISTKIFSGLLTILTLGIDKLSSIKKPSDTVKMIAVATTIGLVASCKVIKPETTNSTDKSDSTIIKKEYVPVLVPGANVAGSINYDSLYKIWRNTLPTNASNTNTDSLFKAFLKTFKTGEKTTIVDPNSKVQLEYWMDAYGKLNISCSSKDQTLQLLTTEITRLTKIATQAKKVEVVVKAPQWAWISLAFNLLLLGALLLILFLLFKTRS